ncbi:MAG: peptidoglycan-associated outer rane lipoprotein [Labilithrix sp.]|nr:peptidoglycan-associated outer rane lipoprotein [Labilithrix sp.]
MRRSAALFLAASAVSLLSLAGCAKKPLAKEPETTSARTRSNVHVSEDIMKACKIHVDNVDRAPKFDYDDADLQPEDRDVLEQVAKCVTTGPLKGRHLSLVGRCDPRGEVEYNMVLGDYRAETVHDYLAKLGVDPATMGKTSRGELDAQGKDEDGWRRDRRVDISLSRSGSEKDAKTAQRD